MFAVMLLFWLKLGPSRERVPPMQVLSAAVPGGHVMMNAPVGAGVPGSRVYVWFSRPEPQLPAGDVAPNWLSLRQRVASPGLASYCEINLWPCVQIGRAHV